VSSNAYPAIHFKKKIVRGCKMISELSVHFEGTWDEYLTVPAAYLANNNPTQK